MIQSLNSPLTTFNIASDFITVKLYCDLNSRQPWPNVTDPRGLPASKILTHVKNSTVLQLIKPYKTLYWYQKCFSYHFILSTTEEFFCRFSISKHGLQSLHLHDRRKFTNLVYLFLLSTFLHVWILSLSSLPYVLSLSNPLQRNSDNA